MPLSVPAGETIDGGASAASLGLGGTRLAGPDLGDLVLSGIALVGRHLWRLGGFAPLLSARCDAEDQVWEPFLELDG